MSAWAPCKDCETRHLGCHSECERYREFRVRCDLIATNRFLDKQKTADSIEVLGKRKRRRNPW